MRTCERIKNVRLVVVHLHDVGVHLCVMAKAENPSYGTPPQQHPLLHDGHLLTVQQKAVSNKTGNVIWTLQQSWPAPPHIMCQVESHKTAWQCVTTSGELVSSPPQ
jgi:hypothetical protein